MKTTPFIAVIAVVSSSVLLTQCASQPVDHGRLSTYPEGEKVVQSSTITFAGKRYRKEVIAMSSTRGDNWVRMTEL